MPRCFETNAFFVVGSSQKVARYAGTFESFVALFWRFRSKVLLFLFGGGFNVFCLVVSFAWGFHSRVQVEVYTRGYVWEIDGRILRP